MCSMRLVIVMLRLSDICCMMLLRFVVWFVLCGEMFV